MSFTSVGEFYEVAPRGVGEFYEVSPTGSLGAYYDIAGFGAAGSSFSADAVWADAQLGGSCYLPSVKNLTAEMEGRCNAAGGRATRALQGALNKLGYGPLDVDGQYGPITGAAWKRFAAANGVPSGPGLMNYAGLKKMEEKLVSKAGFAMWGIGLLVVGAIGAIAYAATRPKKKTYKGPYKMNASGFEFRDPDDVARDDRIDRGDCVGPGASPELRRLLAREGKLEKYEASDADTPLTHGELIARGKRRAKAKRRREAISRARAKRVRKRIR